MDPVRIHCSFKFVTPMPTSKPSSLGSFGFISLVEMTAAPKYYYTKACF